MLIAARLIQAIGAPGPSVFWINLPICALVILLTALFVPESKSATMRDLDPVGQLLRMATRFSIVYVLIEAPNNGWADPATLAAIVLAVLALTGFLV